MMEERTKISKKRIERYKYLQSEVNKLYKEGLDMVEISKKLGISLGSVHYYIYKEKKHESVEYLY